VPDAERVLVVDDDAAVREMLTEYLASHGYEVAAADSGPAMRAEIERALPDVILLDVQLPGEDGLTLARYLRERYDVGIIMVTGATDPVDRVIGLEVGADDYIGKPLTRESFARASRACCAACRPGPRPKRGPRPPRHRPPAATRAGFRWPAARSTSSRTSCLIATAARSRSRRWSSTC